MKIKKIPSLILSLSLFAPISSAYAQDSTHIAPNTSVNVLSTSPNYVSSDESKNLSGHNYTQLQINNLQSQVNLLINKVKILEEMVNETNKEIVVINNTINQRLGKNCMQKGSTVERKHGEIYNARTGGGDDAYYSTLYQCVDGTIKAIGQNNMQ